MSTKIDFRNKLLTLVILLLIVNNYQAQSYSVEYIPGMVSYVSSQNIYVSLNNQNNIAIGDTLFQRTNTTIKAAMIIQYISSRSVAGSPIGNFSFSKGDTLFARIINKTKIGALVSEDAISNEEEVFPIDVENQNLENNSNLRGRLSVSSYSTTSNHLKSTDQRWRYLFSLKGEKIYNSPFSIDSYISFKYRNSEWSEVTSNVGKAAKIYSLAIKYNFDEDHRLTLGRTFNKWISNMGTMDGIQLENKFGGFYTGIVIGSRPNLSDYGYNMKLLQFGGYVGRADTIGSGIMQNSVAFVQQTNDYKIDRRFIYIQHSNSSIEKVNIFASTEIDLYARHNGSGENKINITGLYASIRYAPVRWFSINTSYDARKNVVYYETYKSYADSLLESNTRQGARLRLNFRPLSGVNVGVTYGYRFRADDSNPSSNYSISLSSSKVPLLQSNVYFSYTNFTSNYFQGQIIGGRISKDIFSNTISTAFGYRHLLYDYSNNSRLKQNILSLDLTTTLSKILFLSANYEGTFQENNTYSRLFLNLTYRF
ncbi:MAG: hypothetical protein KKA84_11110 [Bacteroidetes bacterium]|nr:hypothetical protein [Bacteroidota bacterium]